ncbi:hypothetical protein [Oceanidesulfovibrio marinus]|nr:hypothetical protein [Oceanidesulfovibrio marinus]
MDSDSIFSSYERVPEIVRWILFLPIVFLVSSLLAIFIIYNPFVGAGFWRDRIIGPMLMSMILVGTSALFIPRGKIIIMYVISLFYVFMLGLSIVVYFGGFPEHKLTSLELLTTVLSTAAALSATYGLRPIIKDEIIKKTEANSFLIGD